MLYDHYEVCSYALFAHLFLRIRVVVSKKILSEGEIFTLKDKSSYIENFTSH